MSQGKKKIIKEITKLKIDPGVMKFTILVDPSSVIITRSEFVCPMPWSREEEF